MLIQDTHFRETRKLVRWHPVYPLAEVFFDKFLKKLISKLHFEASGSRLRYVTTNIPKQKNI